MQLAETIEDNYDKIILTVCHCITPEGGNSLYLHTHRNEWLCHTSLCNLENKLYCTGNSQKFGAWKIDWQIDLFAFGEWSVPVSVGCASWRGEYIYLHTLLNCLFCQRVIL